MAVPLDPFVLPTPNAPIKKDGKARALVAIKRLPQPLLKTGCKIIGLSGPIPGPIRRATLAGHLSQVSFFLRC